MNASAHLHKTYESCAEYN